MSTHRRLLHPHPIKKHKWFIYPHVFICNSWLCLFKDSWLACPHCQRGLCNTPLSGARQVTYIHAASSVEIRSADPRKQLCQNNVRDPFMSVCCGRAPVKTRHTQRGGSKQKSVYTGRAWIPVLTCKAIRLETCWQAALNLFQMP